MKKLILFASGLGLAGFALYRYFKIQADLLSQYEYKILGISVKKATPTELSFDIKMRFISKSNIEANVQRIYLDVIVEGKNVGYVTQVEPFIIPANAFSDITLAFSFNPQVVMKNIVEIVLNSASKKDMQFGVNGFAKIKSGFIGATIPIKYDTTIKQYFGLVKT